MLSPICFSLVNISFLSCFEAHFLYPSVFVRAYHLSFLRPPPNRPTLQPNSPNITIKIPIYNTFFGKPSKTMFGYLQTSHSGDNLIIVVIRCYYCPVIGRFKSNHLARFKPNTFHRHRSEHKSSGHSERNH